MTHDPERLLQALAVALAYLAFCLAIVWRNVRRGNRPAVKTGGLIVAHASQTGLAEALARETAEALASAGQPAHVVELGALTADDLARADRLLLIAATTGVGEAPDSAARFLRTVAPTPLDLSGLAFAVLALGDRSYDDFCAFGRRMDEWLQACGAVRLFARLEVDAADPAAIAAWRGGLARLYPELRFTPEAQAPSPWRLEGRSCLNPDSAAEPVYRIVLAPPPGEALAWQAGDVVEISHVAAGATHRREYSIASIPQDDRIELLIRRRLGADGRPGVMSAWLIDEAPSGAPTPLKVRANSSFHAPPGPHAAILIGAGTGLAGLRAHLKARAAAGLKDAWLIFGERTRDADFLLEPEIRAWREAGVISRLDLAFSRDADGPAYVQDVLLAAADHVRAQVSTGADVFVCGSHSGMGQSVHAAFNEILGADALEHLIEDGRYRRDIY